MDLKKKAKAQYRNISEELSPLTVSAFILSTGLMLYQHSLGWSWDFGVYSMIGHYIFHDGFYMEWLRPPVASVIMGLMQFIVPRRIAEYLFIVFSSTVFLYSTKRVSEAYEIDFESFYIFMLTPAAILYSTVAGTEMLSLAFAMLFLADLDSPKTGIWLGLAFLTRYNYGLLIPLTFLQKDLAKTVKTGIISGLTLIPWLLYNYVTTGNPLTSFGNFLMLNVFLRHIDTPLGLENFLLISLPSAVILLSYIKPEVREKISLNKINLFMLGFTGLTAFSYFTADLRTLRYLYPLVLPVGFYASKAWEEIGLREILTALLALNIIFGGISIAKHGMADPHRYKKAAGVLDQCMAESEDWTHLNYAGVPTRPVSSKEITMERLKKGYRSVSFKDTGYRNLSAPVIADTETFTIYGYEDRCAEQVKADSTYLDGFNERTDLNYTFSGYIYERVIQDKLKVLK
ncbi:MAG: hypothetical protein ABEK04_04740 [Candidatus Nanohalobium sp.]